MTWWKLWSRGNISTKHSWDFSLCTYFVQKKHKYSEAVPLVDARLLHTVSFRSIQCWFNGMYPLVCNSVEEKLSIFAQTNVIFSLSDKQNYVTLVHLVVLFDTFTCLWAGYLSRYSDWLQAGLSGDQIPVGMRFSAPVQTSPGVHPASCRTGTESIPGVKSGRDVTLTPHQLLVPWSWKSRAIPLLPLWAVRPVQSLSACTRVHFTFYLLHVSSINISHHQVGHFFFLLAKQQWARVFSFTRFLDHTQWRTTVSRTPLDEWSARRRDLYLTTHNTHNTHTHTHPCPDGIRTNNLSRRGAAFLPLRPRGYWDEQVGHWYTQTRGEDSPYKQIILAGQDDIVRYSNTKRKITFYTHCI